MVKNLLPLFIFLNVFHCVAQSDFYYLNDSYYNGNPKTVKTSIFIVQSDSAKSDEIIVQDKETLLDVYNKNKKCISHQWQNLDGEINREFRFNYDHKDNRIEFIIFGKNAVLKERYLTILDSNQNEISHEIYNSENQLISRTFENKTLDDSKETTLTTDETGTIVKKQISIIDSIGREIRSLNYYDYSELPNEFLYKYNEDNQLVESIKIIPNDDTIITKYKYDSLGREVELSQYNKMSNRCILSYNTVFHDSINQREYLEYNNRQLVRSSYNYLDSNQCIIKIVDYCSVYPSLLNRVKKIEHYETETRFQYDEQLNWVEKTEYYNGKRMTIKKRVFQYY
jgi:hypothetical protein